MENESLKGLRVLVTRPRPEGERLTEKIQLAGGQVTYFPTVVVRSCGLTEFTPPLTSFDWLIFTSLQAVYHSLPLLGTHWPATLKVAAMGQGTADCLQANTTLPPPFYPETDWGSEGLLKTEPFQRVEGKKIALIQGARARPWLAHELKSRKALVTAFIVYERMLPEVDAERLIQQLNHQQIDMITVTSNDILQNLITLVGAKAAPRLFSLPLIVVSQRIAESARKVGFNSIFLVQNASHDAMMAGIKQAKDELWQLKRKHPL